jgi:glycosyltransferase involved in cell wall biosynthesis
MQNILQIRLTNILNNYSKRVPILLKNKTEVSPGIICFNHNEALFGVPAKFNKVKKFLSKLSLNKEWIFGIHIQGDLSWYGTWKRESWQDFFMWSDKNDTCLQGIAEEKKTELTCINFYDSQIFQKKNKQKIYDICNISRFSSIKKIDLTLQIFKKILDNDINKKLLLVAPYPSFSNLILSSFSKEKRYLKKALKNMNTIFSAQQLKQIDFICSDSEIFGNFPITEDTLYNLINSSENLLLNSHQEGVPRVIIESLCLNTKVIVSNKLRSGIGKYLNSNNSFIFSEEENENIEEQSTSIANQIINYMNNNKTTKIINNQNNFFDKNISIPKLKDFFFDLFKENKINLNDKESDWHLYDLNKRLACHGYAYDLYFMNNDEAFFNWFSKINNYKLNRVEDFLYKESSFLDKKTNYLKKIIFFLNYYISRIKYKLSKK